MDRWVDAIEADEELHDEWREDIDEFARHTQQNHDITGDQIKAAW
jgi:hypothetical protein